MAVVWSYGYLHVKYNIIFQFRFWIEPVYVWIFR